MSRVVVAIDGPAGSGKSTIAAGLAVRLGVPHVDTGAYYRAATFIAHRSGVPVDDQDQVLAAVQASTIERAGARTRVDGADVEDVIRQPAINAQVSAVARHPGVRRYMATLQRAAVTAKGAVVEGRDAGTVVVPDADLKVWLTAAVDTRAARRAQQAGITGPDEIAAEADRLTQRDEQDAQNMLNAGHTVRAVDDVEVDTTGLSVAHVIERVAQLALDRAQVQS